MGYFENLAETAFKKSSDGETHFFRWGVLGKSILVPGTSEKEEVKKFLSNFYRFGLPLGIISATFLKWMALPIIPVLLLYYEIGMRKRTKGWIQSNEKMNLGQTYSKTAKIYSPAFLWFGAVFSVLFVIGGIFFILKTQKTMQGIMTIIVFGICFVVYVNMLRLQKRSYKTSDTKDNWQTSAK